MKDRKRILVSVLAGVQQAQICLQGAIAMVDPSCFPGLEETGWSFQVERLGTGRFRITNRGTVAINNVPVASDADACIEFTSGDTFDLGSTRVCITDFDEYTLDVEAATVDLSASNGASPAPATLAKWFESLGKIQRHASCSPEFYQSAVDAIVEPGGLDAALILKRHNSRWLVTSRCVPAPPIGMVYDPVVVETAWQTGRPIYREYTSDQAAGKHKDCVLAVPVKDGDDTVKRLVYCCRRISATNRRRGIRQLESQWIQLVAEAVAAGVIRRDHETNAARQRVLLDQCFPREFVRQLGKRDPAELLVSEERDITVMFSDLLGSSGISEKLSPTDTHHLLADALDLMTEAVQDEGGTVVDYYGDGLIAMWNAPFDQVDHAARACRAGLNLVQRRSELDTQWSKQIGRPIRFGVGIHTGRAMVGNSGSRRRLKYGPRGLVVNVASRVEKATRNLETPLLISKATLDRLDETAKVCRLGKFKLWGIDDPVEMYSLFGLNGEGPTRLAKAKTYELVLALLEGGDLESALDELDTISCSIADEYSLEFLRRQLESRVDWLEAQPLCDSKEELVFDLTSDST